MPGPFSRRCTIAVAVLDNPWYGTYFDSRRSGAIDVG